MARLRIQEEDALNIALGIPLKQRNAEGLEEHGEEDGQVEEGKQIKKEKKQKKVKKDKEKTISSGVVRKQRYSDNEQDSESEEERRRRRRKHRSDERG